MNEKIQRIIESRRSREEIFENKPNASKADCTQPLSSSSSYLASYRIGRVSRLKAELSRGEEAVDEELMFSLAQFTHVVLLAQLHEAQAKVRS